jgi:hypothetical protein
MNFKEFIEGKFKLVATHGKNPLGIDFEIHVKWLTYQRFG